MLIRTYSFSILFTLILSLFARSVLSQENFKTTYPVNSNIVTYWQQHVDYTMEIDMNIENYQYTGKQKLVYTNNSPDDLTSIYYHLYPNAFQPGSDMDARLHTIIDPDQRMIKNIGTKDNPNLISRISQLKPDEIGFIKVKSLLQNGVPITYKIEGTILEVNLKQTIKPGEKHVFDMEFLGQVPIQIRRSGRNNKCGVALSMTQWYPKMAEYDFEGWHTDPYITREFYGVWGDFDVSIRIDKNYMLGGTGNLQNPQEVGFGYENSKLPLKLTKGNTRTWHFKAPNVHDFAWVADANFVHDIKKLANGTQLHFLYKDEIKTKELWKKIQPIAVETMEFYNNYIGEYAYEQYSILQGGDGGMEYPMCTLITGERSFKSLAGVMMHEMGHAWFQFALATNESKHGWMDEGFTMFVEAMASNKIMKNKGDFIFDKSYEYYRYMVQTGDEEPLTTHSDRYASNISYGINAYDKGCVFVAQLGYIMGQEFLESTIKKYFKKWTGKHPSPNDFIRVAESVSGLELNWYLNEFTQTTHNIDYAVKEIKDKQITIERIGRMPMPIDLQVTYTDGSVANFYIPLDLMRGEKPTQSSILPDWSWAHPTYIFETSKNVKKVIIDPSQLLADYNKKNNSLNLN